MPSIRLPRRRPKTSSFPRVPKRQSPHRFQIRFQSNQSPSDSTANRISRILTSTSRFLPKRLQNSLQNLRSAPLSHVSAFLVLHEITAIVPVLGLTYAFYVLDFVPTGWGLGAKRKDGQEDTVDDGAFLVRKEKGDEAYGGPNVVVSSSLKGADAAASGVTSTVLTGEVVDEAMSKTSIAIPQVVKDSGKGEKSGKLSQYAMQMAAAYAITKVLLVPRIALSLWLTPWLAKGFVGFRQRLRRIRR
ncbi:hypothetical protein GGR50DRAFT_482881 [Xylaria sp. CBS 124048]|nr:hypothetical protein GGR50DRAFT_482881 [Xylaria sp. CBS 124048]